MKLSLLDKIVGYFSPSAGLNRVRSKKSLDLIRQYDSASTYNSTDWTTASNRSANAETRTALSLTRNRSRDLVRNSAYANKALNVIVSNSIGPGIVPKIKGRIQGQEKAVNKLWKQWAETTLCDFDGVHNFYSMQAAAMRSVVEGGELIAKKLVNGKSAQLQILESDYINERLSNNINCISGIWIDPKTGRVEAYELYDRHPGDFRGFGLQSQKYGIDEIIHMFRIERVGQLRGMPWYYPVATALKDYADYQNATLIRQKISACWTAFITEAEGDGIRDQVKLAAMRATENTLEPGSTRYLAPGQTVTMANPPGVDQYDEFSRQTLRAIASGLGISYESLTSDYSQVNFSSGRMGHLEMQRNIDMWRWQMFIPQFCDPAFNHFLKWCEIQGVDTTGITWQWTCPAREMIDPTKELAALKDAVRSGFKTLPEAIREQGLDPDIILEEIAETNQKLDDLKIILDSDPRKTNGQGVAQITNSAFEESENTSNEDTNVGKTNKTNDSKPGAKG